MDVSPPAQDDLHQEGMERGGPFAGYSAASSVLELKEHELKDHEQKKHELEHEHDDEVEINPSSFLQLQEKNPLNKVS